VVRPEGTEGAFERFNDWLSRRGGRIALIAAVVFGATLIVRGIVDFR
jgi:hypothetical protein